MRVSTKLKPVVGEGIKRTAGKNVKRSVQSIEIDLGHCGVPLIERQ